MATDSKQKLRNIGPTSARGLRAVGIVNLSTLRNTGAVQAWRHVYAAGFTPSINLVYALEGAIQDTHWLELPEDRPNELKHLVTQTS